MKTVQRFALLFPLLAACGAGDDATLAPLWEDLPGTSSDERVWSAPPWQPVTSGSHHWYLVSDLDLAFDDGSGFVDGINLDGRVSDRSDLASCRREDSTSPDGVLGVDNQLGPALAELEELIGFRRMLAGYTVEPNVFALQLRGVDSVVEDDRFVGDDDFVEVLLAWVRVSRSAEADTSVEFTAITPVDVFPASIVAGRLQTGSGTMTMLVPSLDGTGTPITLSDLVLRLTPSGAALERGVAGAKLDVEEYVEASVRAMGSEFEPTARFFASNLADLDFRDGTCRSVSIGMTFGATSIAHAEIVPDVAPAAE